MKIKRIVAYIIDFFVITFISAVIGLLPMFDSSKEATMSYYEYFIDVIENSGSSDIDEEVLQDKAYENTKNTANVGILSLGVTVAYFAIFGYLNKGATLGKKVMKIKIVGINDEEIKPGLYFLREILKTNAIFDFINLILLLLCSKTIYLSASNYLSYASNIVILLIIGTMIFRDDERGLHDVICKTNVISTEETK